MTKLKSGDCVGLVGLTHDHVQELIFHAEKQGVKYVPTIPLGPFFDGIYLIVSGLYLHCVSSGYYIDNITPYKWLQTSNEEEEMSHYDNERENDLVNNPKHYQLFADGTEAIEIIQATLSREEFTGYLKGNALKYRLRAGEKGDLQQDIDKANWYKNKLSEFLG